MKNDTKVGYSNPLLKEQEEVGKSDERAGAYANPMSKSRETRNDVATKMSCKCEKDDPEYKESAEAVTADATNDTTDEVESVVYVNPLLEEEEKIGKGDERVGAYPNPMGKSRETRNETATKMSCKCEKDDEQ